MENSQITNIYVQAYMAEKKRTGSKLKAKKAGQRAIFRKGYYLDKGVWKKASSKMSPSQKKSFSNRADESRVLANVQIDKDGMA